MRIEVDPSSLLRTRWYEFAVRFLFGGIITACAGLVAKRFGPAVGGLFLAFPAIFPASATLIEKHEKQRKERLGLHGSARGRKAAGVDAAGTALGGVGLLGFALVAEKIMPTLSPWLALTMATTVWAVVSLVLWRIRKRL